MINQEETKQSIRDIIDKVDELINDIHSLMLSTYESCFAIKPYEGNDKLTSAQKELFTWFSYVNGKALDESIYLEKTRDRFNEIIR